MLVIFDWDGTLSDSTGKIIRCVQAATKELAFPALADGAIKSIIGLSLPVAMARLYPDIAPADIDVLSATYSRHYVADDHVPGFYAGALEAMAELKDDGFELAVATGKSRNGLNRVLGQLNAGHWFVATRCADETASKPNPLMLSELLSERGRLHHQAVMIGDTSYDLDMAKAIDMPRIAVTYGAHDEATLRQSDPVLCIDDLRKMVPWLQTARQALS